LAPLTTDRPKSLVPVNGKPILFKQIENLRQNGLADITVVAGYKAEVLTAALEAEYPAKRYPDLRIIENTVYATTNNMYSAYLACTVLQGESFLMLNADVFFDASILADLLAWPAENAIATDIGKYNEESMKVVAENGRLLRISKQIAAADALGTSIDIYKFSAAGGQAFLAKCAEYIEDKRERNLWSEVALNDILREVEFVACPVHGRWMEIDTLEDLREAERLFADE
jgi:choline kinase